MKKTFLILLISFFACGVSGQAYLGTVVKASNLRSGPGTHFKSLASVTAGNQVFIVSLDAENDFYNIIDIASNKEGFVHRSLVKVGKQVRQNEAGLFTPSGSSSTEAPEIEIYNNTALKLTLKLNEDLYHFLPQQKRTLLLEAGSYEYRASAPGVIPNIGRESLDSRVSYIWRFFIVRR